MFATHTLLPPPPSPYQRVRTWVQVFGNYTAMHDAVTDCNLHGGGMKYFCDEALLTQKLSNQAWYSEKMHVVQAFRLNPDSQLSGVILLGEFRGQDPSRSHAEILERYVDVHRLNGFKGQALWEPDAWSEFMTEFGLRLYDFETRVRLIEAHSLFLRYAMRKGYPDLLPEGPGLQGGEQGLYDYLSTVDAKDPVLCVSSSRGASPLFLPLPLPLRNQTQSNLL